MPENLPILYSFRRCPYAMRARLALRSAGIKLWLREVHLRNKPAALTDISPKATVPVLQLADGGVVEQSLDIMHWAFDHADPEGMRPKAKQFYDQLAADCEARFKPHLDRFKYQNRYGRDDQQNDPAKHYRHAHAYLAEVSTKITDAGWIDAAQISMADMVIAPFVRQFANADPDWKQQASPILQNWLVQFVQSRRFQAIMMKIPPWSPSQSVEVVF